MALIALVEKRPQSLRNKIWKMSQGPSLKRPSHGKLKLANFKKLANSCVHTSNSRQISTRQFPTWPT